MRENKRVYGVAALAAACALTLTAFAAGTPAPGQSQNGNNNNGSNANANGGGMNANSRGMNANSRGMNANSRDMNANSRGDNGNMGGQMGTTGGGRMGTGQGSGGALSSTDRQFLMKAAMMDLAEIQTGRLAVSQGASESVRQFGQRMIDDHTRTSQQLMQMASATGFAPPQTLDSKHRAVADKLARQTGAAFDRAYMRQMVKDHQEAVSLYQRQSTRGTMPDLRAFAAATLPALQEHLTMARSMANGGGGSMSHNGNTNMGGAGNTNGNSNGNH